ncbi:MAG: hypothetical protein PHU65_03595 [Actinomycetota bacterium]|nr:hypothetical protein [Actinomycetota bacterium]
MESDKKSAAENLGKMFKEFGSAISEIFNDPDLKTKSKEFAESASESAKAFTQRFKDEEVQNKFKEVGKAAQDFGKSMADYFKSENQKEAAEENSSNDEKKTEEPNDDRSGSSAEAPAGLKEESEAEKQEIPENNSFEGKTEKKINQNEDFKAFDGKFDSYFASGRAGRITGYVFSIIFAIAWMIFILFFNQYIAYYYNEIIDGAQQLRMVPVLTEQFSLWLPFFTLGMLVSIIGNLVLVFFERFYLLKIISIITSGLTLSVTAYLLRLFPFDFSLIPNIALKGVASMITSIILIIIMAGCAIAVIIDFIKLIVFFTRSGSIDE